MEGAVAVSELHADLAGAVGFGLALVGNDEVGIAVAVEVGNDGRLGIVAVGAIGARGLEGANAVAQENPDRAERAAVVTVGAAGIQDDRVEFTVVVYVSNHYLGGFGSGGIEGAGGLEGAVSIA